MSYVALYRKYRPQNFSDMIGQEHITKILKNQIVSSKISHAYIFSGTRGTGKTTAAKVFARAVNCLNNQGGEPCNECEACRSILEGNTTDVVEMDAASNNSVENIRSIRQEVAYSTTGLKYKVYIIDEAHMLSTSAFNALLKTLEEPPENVIFILATTEEHKILPTILSRCIRFEFKKIGKDGIVQRLERVLKDYDVRYDTEALQHIAELADGGMRDALSILERCITSGEGEITEQKIEEIIGTVPKKLIQDIVLNILEYNITKVDENINTILSSGKDLRNISASITQEFLKVLIAVSCGDNVDIPEELKDYKFFCFNGNPYCLKIDFDRFVGHRANYYDMNLLPFGEACFMPDFDKELEKPKNFEKMVEIVKKLSENIPFARIDLYNSNGKIYFGELTFYHFSGMTPFVPKDWDYKFGEWIQLP